MMPSRRTWLASAVIVAAGMATAACADTTATATHHPATDCKLERGAHLALTHSYRLVLRIGPVEGMLMPYQVRANHVKHGEVMLGGQMVVPTHGPLHHLEVHICAKKTHVVVAKANPTIVLTDTTKQIPPKTIPVAVMEGISAGRADLHYGNNVSMPHHDRYTITVTLEGQRAVFHVVAP